MLMWLLQKKMRINGVNYSINWRRFRVGWSFFVPCLRLKESELAILVTTKRFGFRVLMKPVIENGIKGLRVWRIK
jgi:hypothetical protein